jgi:hypothetical protein
MLVVALARALIVLHHGVTRIATADMTHGVRFDLKRSPSALKRALHASTGFTIRLVKVLLRPTVFPETLEILPKMMHRLRKVDVNASVVDQNIIHLEVRLLGLVFVLKVNEGVPKTRSRLEVANDVARQYLTKSTENDF